MMALRKTAEPSGAVRSSPHDRPGHDRPGDDRADLMIDPPHPMHRDLLARIATPPTARRIRTNREILTRPPSMAITFYAAIAAWGGVWLLFEALARLL